MDDASRRALVDALTKQQPTFERPQPQGFLPLPEIPEMHQGQLFNLGGRQWSDGRAQSVDLSLQPIVNRQNGTVGLGGAHLIYRRTW